MSNFTHQQLFTFSGGNNNNLQQQQQQPPLAPTTSTFTLGANNFKLGGSIPLQNLSNSLNNSCKTSPATKIPVNNNQTSAKPITAPFITTTSLPLANAPTNLFATNNNNLSVGRFSANSNINGNNANNMKSLAELEAEERALAEEEAAAHRRLESIFAQNQSMDSEFLQLQNSWHEHYALRSQAEREPAPDLSAEIGAAERELENEKEQHGVARQEYENAQFHLGSLAEIRRQLATCESDLERLEQDATDVIAQKRALMAGCQKIADVEAKRDHMLHRVGIILENNLRPPQQQQSRQQMMSMKKNTNNNNNTNNLASSSNNNNISKKQQQVQQEQLDEESEIFHFDNDDDDEEEEDEVEQEDFEDAAQDNKSRRQNKGFIPNSRLSHNHNQTTSSTTAASRAILEQASAILTSGYPQRGNNLMKNRRSESSNNKK